MKKPGFFKALFLIVFTFFVFNNSRANNLVITGTQVNGSYVTFYISWDNSWKTSLAPANWDAIWVFVKYQDCSTRQWYHADLSNSSGDHSTSSPLVVDAVNDGKGVFIRRSSDGGGNISSTLVTLKLNIPSGSFNYKVFGVEMVNITSGSYQVGDGTSSYSFNSVNIDATTQSTGISASTLGASFVQNVPAAYPMGVNAFYAMKYEITQEQYVEFLNTLTYDQQVTRTAIDPISVSGSYAFNNIGYNRNGVKLMTSGNNNVLPAVYACDMTNGTFGNSNDGQNIACNYLSWSDLIAYLDWSALRPMSELEFEKICRGPMTRVAGEYPWGSTAMNYYSSGSVLNGGQANENISYVLNGSCIANFTGTYSQSLYAGPTRVGIFATGSSGRQASGASYYGVMEMGGNVAEQVVNVYTTGVAFTGNNGDGNLSILGNANQTSWPLTGTGSGMRGGDWDDATSYVRTSDRALINSPATTRIGYIGGRGVR